MENEVSNLYKKRLHEAVDVGTSVQPILEEITRTNAGSHLDPLETIPILLTSTDEAAVAILLLLAKECRAKEVVMAVQEAIERVGMLFEDYDSEDDQESAQPNASLSKQLRLLVELFALSVPRLDKRKRSASDIITPLFEDLRSVLRKAGPNCKAEEGREILLAISHLIAEGKKWCRQNSNDEEFLATSLILRETLECAVETLHQCFNSSIAQRSFEQLFSRLTVHSAVPPGWELGEDLAKMIVDAYSDLPSSPQQGHRFNNATSLFFLAHEPDLLASLTPDSLEDLVSPLISSIQTNFLLDEGLAILLHALSPAAPPPRAILPSTVTHPLLAVLPALCSSHPDPGTRHQAYRILSLLLLSCPSEDRLVILYDLARSEEYPQMRVGAIGLIKESVLDAIGRVDTTVNAFGTGKVLKVLGDVLFRPNPPDLFGNYHVGKHSMTYSEAKELMEVTRLSECLALYYAWLLRDVLNATHIRDKDRMDHVDLTFIQPLKQATERWRQEVVDDKHEDRMPLISLQMNLERVCEVLERVSIKPKNV